MAMTSRRAFIGAALAASALQPGCATAGAAEGELPPSTGPEQTDEEAMKVRFLGTGAADWAQAPRTGKIYRRWSSILIDNRFAIDFTKMAPEMLPEGCTPKAIIYTHSHPDHFDPKAAVKLGVKHVFLHRSWLEDARKDFEKAVAEVGGEMPALHPVDVGRRFRLGPYEIQPLPGNHYTGKWYEQALIYKVAKLCKDGPARLLYATDTAGIMAQAFFLGCRSREAVNAVIMEATGEPGRAYDGLSLSHSTADMVHTIFSAVLKPGTSAYKPSVTGQKVYLTHLGCGAWGQNTFGDVLPEELMTASDGLEIEVRPLPKV